MTDTVMIKQAVDPDKVDRLKEWMAEVQAREEEAIATLQNEGMYTESAFLERTDDGPYLVYYMEAEDIDQAFEEFEESNLDLDQEHLEVMQEVLVDGRNVGDYELLYHLTNPER